MGMSAAHCQGNVREFQSVWRVVTLCLFVRLLRSTSRTFIASLTLSIDVTTATSHRPWRPAGGRYVLDPRHWPATDLGHHTSTSTSVCLFTSRLIKGEVNLNIKLHLNGSFYTLINKYHPHIIKFCVVLKKFPNFEVI